jgi:hypothetical protein
MKDIKRFLASGRFLVKAILSNSWLPVKNNWKFSTGIVRVAGAVF